MANEWPEITPITKVKFKIGDDKIYQKIEVCPLKLKKQEENDFDYIDQEMLEEKAEDSIANGCTPIFKEVFDDFEYDYELEKEQDW